MVLKNSMKFILQIVTFADKVKALAAAGVSRLQVQEQLGISKASYYHCLKVEWSRRLRLLLLLACGEALAPL